MASEIAGLAQSLGYSTFTPLQELAFSNPDCFRYDKNLFIIGATSSGKTLIPLLIYYDDLLRRRQAREAPPKMLFVVPYRALAAQKVEELAEFFSKEGLSVVQSTGEFRQDDETVQEGGADIAVVITEKVYKYASRDSDFLAKYDYLVLDEIGLLESGARGIRLDFILVWAMNSARLFQKPRTMALGTPFFDWTSYIDSYRFIRIESEKRPVEIVKYPVVFDSKHGISRVTEGNPCLRRAHMISERNYNRRLAAGAALECDCGPEGRCPIGRKERFDPSLRCPEAGGACVNPLEIRPDASPSVFREILLRICRCHLAQKHQILVFVNNREEVKELCREMYLLLQDRLETAADPAAFKRDFLAMNELDEEDVFGILDDDTEAGKELIYYRALSAGVCFHSAALPNELRSYIERSLAGDDRLKIVFSTETLAFGINSSVDVVVVASLEKQENSAPRFLTLNEYNNYIGRAGRLRRAASPKTVNRGYVYTLIRMKQETKWNEMLAGQVSPPRLFSNLYERGNRTIPFILLNLLPADGSAVGVSQLYDTLRAVPSPDMDAMDETAFSQSVNEAAAFLQEQQLIAEEKVPRHARMMARGAAETRFGLTPLGRRLRGYIISEDDYLLLKEALEASNPTIFQELDVPHTLYYLLRSRHVESGLSNAFHMSDSKWDMNDLMEYYYSCFGGILPDWFDEQDGDPRHTQVLYVLAAVLQWTEGESAQSLYRRFGIHYALLGKLTEQLAYLLEVAQGLLPALIERLWRERRENYERFGISEDSVEKVTREKAAGLSKLFNAVYFGINTDIADKLAAHLRASPEPGAAALAEELAIERLNPTSARKLRRVIVRYRFFRDPYRPSKENIEAWNNYNNQRRQYLKDVGEMEPCVRSFFDPVIS